MVIFLYGENSYAAWQQLKKIRAKHEAANSEIADQIVLDAKQASYIEINRQINTLPFLAKSRLVVVKNLLSVGKKELQEKISSSLAKVPASTILVFYENKLPDKRTKIFKKFSKEIKTTKEYKLLDDYELKQWVVSEFSSKGKNINNNALERLIAYVGNDQWRLSNEIAKLALYNPDQTTIGLNEVELLVRAKVDSNIFGLVDEISLGNYERAIFELNKLYADSVYELVIFSMVIRQFRNLLLVKEGVLLRQTNLEIKQTTGLHPFVIGKTKQQSQKYTLDELKVIYSMLLDYDSRLKQGDLEPKLGIELLIMQICLKNNKALI